MTTAQYAVLTLLRRRFPDHRFRIDDEWLMIDRDADVLAPCTAAHATHYLGTHAAALIRAVERRLGRWQPTVVGR